MGAKETIEQKIRSESQRVLDRGNTAIRLSILIFILSTVGLIFLAMSFAETQECDYSFYLEQYTCDEKTDAGIAWGIIIWGTLVNLFTAFLLTTWGNHLRLSAYKGFHAIGEGPQENVFKPFIDAPTQQSTDKHDIQGDDLDNEPSNEPQNNIHNQNKREIEPKKKDDGPSSFLSLFNPFK